MTISSDGDCTYMNRMGKKTLANNYLFAKSKKSRKNLNKNHQYICIQGSEDRLKS